MVRRFSFIYGLIFLIVGAAGFIPGMTVGHMHPDMRVTTGMGLELGLFPVNVLHNLVHVLFGVWGLVAARTLDASVLYARAVAVVYAVLGVMGLIPALNLHTTFGLVPLYGHDIWLHFALALVAAYFGFARRSVPGDATVLG